MMTRVDRAILLAQEITEKESEINTLREELSSLLSGAKGAKGQPSNGSAVLKAGQPISLAEVKGRILRIIQFRPLHRAGILHALGEPAPPERVLRQALKEIASMRNYGARKLPFPDSVGRVRTTTVYGLRRDLNRLQAESVRRA